MSAKYAPGDKVKVTFEGKVVAAPSNEWVGVELDDGLIHWVKSDERVARVEKQYETFGPGDVVRSRTGGEVRALSESGWINLDTGRFYPGAITAKAGFTSASFERVEV